MLKLIAKSTLYGLASAVLLLIALSLLSIVPLIAPIGQKLAMGYFYVGSFIEPIIWSLMPWATLFPDGGAAGVFALVLTSSIMTWGMLLSVWWYLFFQRKSRKRSKNRHHY